MLGDPYLHPSGQIPAYEWNFGDVNPPVHAWATMFTYTLDKLRHGEGDVEWLERAFEGRLPPLGPTVGQAQHGIRALSRTHADHP